MTGTVGDNIFFFLVEFREGLQKGRLHYGMWKLKSKQQASEGNFNLFRKWLGRQVLRF